MNILVTGGCGFVGSSICTYLKKKNKNLNILSVDNLSKIYSKYNQRNLKKNKINNKIINMGNIKKFQNLKFKADFIIDCSAEPSVEASRKNISKVIESNFLSTLNVLEKAKRDKSKVIFLSSSRVYPIKLSYNKFKKYVKTGKHNLYNENDNVLGIKTIYGFSKLSSEELIKEYMYSNKIEYIINRCGLISGPGQFGKMEQGLVSLWMWKHINKKKIYFIGYNGSGKQIRDVLFVDDLCDLILKQIKNFKKFKNNLFCVGGGKKNAVDLKKLTYLCETISGNKIKVFKINKTSNYDIPYYVTSLKKILKISNWKPNKNLKSGLEETYRWMVENKTQIKNYF